MNKLLRSCHFKVFVKRTTLSSSEKTQFNRTLSVSPIINNINNNNSENGLVTCDYSHDDKIALVAFNAPDKLNALSVDMGHAFKATIQNLSTKKDLRALILTGKGKAFSAGGDLDWLIERHHQSDKMEENSKTMVGFYKMFLSLRKLECPIIAAINGPAIGAGFCVAIGGCDIRIASNKAKMGLNFVKIGLHPGMAATHFLPALVGPSTAASLLLTGKIIGAEEALNSGLVSKICDDPVAESIELAEEIAFKSAPMAVKTCLETLRQKQNIGLEEAMKRESEAQAITYATKDFLDGVTAIKQKRTPVFQGK